MRIWGRGDRLVVEIGEWMDLTALFREWKAILWESSKTYSLHLQKTEPEPMNAARLRSIGESPASPSQRFLIFKYGYICRHNFLLLKRIDPQHKKENEDKSCPQQSEFKYCSSNLGIPRNPGVKTGTSRGKLPQSVVDPVTFSQAAYHTPNSCTQ